MDPVLIPALAAYLVCNALLSIGWVLETHVNPRKAFRRPAWLIIPLFIIVGTFTFLLITAVTWLVDAGAEMAR